MSDGDDMDEDELLQIALREQVERDVNYRRPPSASSKPVLNHVQLPTLRSKDRPHQRSRHGTAPQPPPPPAAAAAAASKGKEQGAGRRSAAEEDDDSEVEMLSISSGDEDSPAKDRGFVGGAGRGRVGPRRGGRDEASDRGWDGEEPNSWKRVDEAELGRRVREMRETKAVPVPQTFERKGSTVGRKGLTHVQSLARGMEFVDPLGLGVLDSRTLTLISDASESSPTISKGKPDAVDPISRDKMNFFSEKFDPKIFLSRVHNNTSATDLESGALALKTDFKGRTQQKKQLVKENFDCFISCKTTIDDIESKLKRIEEDPEGVGTTHLFNSIQNVATTATRALEPLFERQAQAEKIRSVQGMIQRFRTLFNLPSSIRGSISKGEYVLAVREYRKAKSIELPSHVGILKRVLEEVEKVMEEFKGMLYKSMEDPRIELGELENTVRLLLELEPDSEPVWHYLNIQNQRIRGLLERCSLDHEVQMEALRNGIRERVLSDEKWRQTQQDSSKSTDIDYSLLLGGSAEAVDSQSVELTGEEVDALRGKYVRRLTTVLVSHLPAFWRLAVSVFSGKFAKPSQVASGLRDSATNPKLNKSEAEIGEVRCSNHSLDEVAEMVLGTISIYEDKIHAAFRDLEESNILRPYMRDTIKEISKACQALEGKDCAPPDAVKLLRALHLEISKIYIMRLCSWMRTITEEISKAELWVPVSVIERQKSPYAISYLPLAFHAMIVSAMDEMNVLIQDLQNEAASLDELYEQVQEIQASIRLAFINCFLDFAGCLGRMAGDLSHNDSLNYEDSFLQNGYIEDHEKNSIESTSDSPAFYEKLLIVLSNIGYCKNKLSHELYNKYKHIWLSTRERDEDDPDIRDLELSFGALEERVLEQYTHAKSNKIRESAINYLSDSGVQWGSAPVVKGVRDSAVELLHTLVAVYAEVFACAKPLLEKVLGILVEGFIDTLLSLCHEKKAKELKCLDANGFCQLMLELEYFETILNKYFTSEAHGSLKSLQEFLLEKATEGGTETMENPGHHRRSTRGSEDGIADDKQQGLSVSPDDLIALSQQCSSELLQAVLERTRLNIACFMEAVDPLPDSAKAAYSSLRGPFYSPSKNNRGVRAVGSPSFSRHRRR